MTALCSGKLCTIFSGTHVISDFYGLEKTINAEGVLDIIVESCIRNDLTFFDSGIHVVIKIHYWF